MNVDLAELFVGALRWAINEARDSGASTISLAGKMQSIDDQEAAAILAAIQAAIQSPNPAP